LISLVIQWWETQSMEREIKMIRGYSSWQYPLHSDVLSSIRKCVFTCKDI